MLDQCDQGQQETKGCERAIENKIVVSQVRERDPPPPEIDPSFRERVEQKVGVRQHRPKPGREKGLGGRHALADDHVQEVDRGDREGNPPDRGGEDGVGPERPDAHSASRRVSQSVDDLVCGKSQPHDKEQV